MRKIVIIGAALCALSAGPARAEACQGRPGDIHLLRVGDGPAPLFFAMAWNGPPRLEKTVAVRCLFVAAEPAPPASRKDRRRR